MQNNQAIPFNKENFKLIFSKEFALVIVVSVPSAIVAEFFNIPLAWFLGPMLITSLASLMGLKIKSKNINSVRKFVNSLKLFGYGYSWGGFESLALHQEIREQGDRSYLNLPKDEHIVRLHIGLEDPKDLIEDLRRSLKFIK